MVGSNLELGRHCMESGEVLISLADFSSGWEEHKVGCLWLGSRNWVTGVLHHVNGFQPGWLKYAYNTAKYTKNLCMWNPKK